MVSSPPRETRFVMEIKIPRIDVSFGNALKWSADGQIAIATAFNVVIYQPVWSTEGIRFDRLATTPVESLPSALEDLPVTDKGFAIGGSGVQNSVTDIAWSPSGMSENRGCFLAVLTNSSEVYLFHNPGDPTKGTWPLRFNITEMLLDEIGNSSENRRDAMVHSMAWSPPINTSRWGLAKLALGTESGAVHIYTTGNGLIAREDAFQLEKLPLLMAWSTKGLWIVTNDNAVHLRSSSTGKIKQLCPPSRFLVVAIEPLKDSLIVASCGLAQIVSEDNVEQIKLPFVSPTVGILANETDKGAYWDVCDSKGQVYPSSKFSGPQINREKQVDLVVFGADTHPCHPDTAAFVYGVYQPNSYRFPILSAQSSRLGLVADKVAGNVVYPVLKGSSLANWWNLEPTQYKVEVSQLTLSSPLLKFEDELFQVLSREELDQLRLNVHFGFADILEIRTILATLVLQRFHQNTGLSDIDRAVLLSLNSYVAPELQFKSSETNITITGDFFTETFDFGAATDPNEIVSVEGRKWKRCCLTLLPIVSVETLVSSGGPYTKLDPSWSVVQSSVIATGILTAIDFCLFTGARWYSRRHPKPGNSDIKLERD